MDTLSSLYPVQLWQHFQNVCSIPHPSKHEKALSEYIINFCKRSGIDVRTDSVGNIIAKKPATVGYEERASVVLQAHLDMVPQKNSSTQHDFLTDPITPVIDGDWVKAQNTTLGADNGIGVAAILAILESKTIAHGPLEALFTIDEETGMTGAIGLEPEALQSTILLNLDSEDDTELIIGCAGGVNFEAQYTYKTETIENSDDYKVYHLSIGGLNGGHSGIDIDLERANANQLLARFLWAAIQKNVLVSSFGGGNMRNAIPREAFATLLVPVEAKERIKKLVDRFQKLIKQEFKGTEKKIDIELLRPNDKEVSTYIASYDMEQILRALLYCPNGVVTRNFEWDYVVETSTNLSIVECKESIVHVSCLLRSSDNEKKQQLATVLSQSFSLYGFEIKTNGDYPGWQPKTTSSILQTVQTVYPKIIGEKPQVKIIHAGLECGIIARSHPNLDMISFGPTICHPHSPDEKVSITSVGKFWNLLQEVLKEIPKR